MSIISNQLWCTPHRLILVNVWDFLLLLFLCLFGAKNKANHCNDTYKVIVLNFIEGSGNQNPRRNWLRFWYSLLSIIKHERGIEGADICDVIIIVKTINHHGNGKFRAWTEHIWGQLKIFLLSKYDIIAELIWFLISDWTSSQVYVHWKLRLKNEFVTLSQV